MSNARTFVLSGCILLSAGAALVGAPAQDATPYPGQPTRARVWIQNRGDAEAIPVAIENMAPDAAPLKVQVIGPVTIDAPGAASARPARQAWEYETIRIPSGADVVALLNAAGTDGWETTGLSFAAQGGTAVVMKRPE